jgi:uncharacterized protein (DUF1501 family)
MLTRRNFLARSTLLSFGPLVPQFLAKTALAAEPGKDTILVVLEMTGGNDGLNMVIPYADDLYHKFRPTLRVTKKDVLKIDDYIGLHPSLAGLHQMLQAREFSIIQGVGYPNSERSHFESMDVWQSADTRRQQRTGWLARGVPLIQDAKGNIPAMHLAADKTPLPLALTGAAGGVLTLNRDRPFDLELTGDADRQIARRKLIDDLAKMPANGNDSADFVRRRQVQAYASIERLREILKEPEPNRNPSMFAGADAGPNNGLLSKFQLIAKLIAKGFGSRVYYTAIDGFDTHSNQASTQAGLLSTLSAAISNLFAQLKQSKDAERVVLLTFSEFGRRVKENGTRGTDHGAASCLFLAGPAVTAGLVGHHPRLDDLDAGDLKHQIDFRQIYASLLDQWLGCNSATVLGAKFPLLPLVKKPA